ncbi:hypothetical protein [Sphingobacterium paludis]|uniref:hypothetical protein n=1 Tax=Sphingobacterium paludis TaxID=1476465 RepID=UPI00141502E6|nr:hypothetical protein [Sphingobacterium paludis]
MEKTELSTVFPGDNLLTWRGSMAFCISSFSLLQGVVDFLDVSSAKPNGPNAVR